MTRERSVIDGIAAAPVWPQLERLLPLVQKPIQYVGGELNSTPKDWDAADVRWCLMYPDAYEVGLPNQGVQILSSPQRAGPVLAERTYSVWLPRGADAPARRAPVHLTRTDRFARSICWA